MTLEQLQSFIHLASTGSMSQSAFELGISQPTLSRHIASLETLLGQTLIDRTHRPMRLTAVGRFFYENAQKSISELGELITLTQNFGKSAPNTLTIGFVASILYGLLPEIIGKLKQSLPSLNVHLLEVGSYEQILALKSGQIDVGFGRFLCDDVFVRQIFLRHERLLVALPNNHKLSQKSALSLKNLTKDTLILYHRNPLVLSTGQTSDPLLHLFDEKNLSPASTQRVRDLQIALGLVSAGEGITLVPESLTSVRSKQVCYLPLSENATSPIYLNVLNHSPSPNLTALIHAVCAVYDDRGISYPSLLTNL